jgi:hypothetical protein
MGYYLNQDINGNPLPALGKVESLIASGAKKNNGEAFVDDMVCVVNNGFFEAAAYLYSEEEYKYFKGMSNVKGFLVVPNAKSLAS